MDPNRCEVNDMILIAIPWLGGSITHSRRENMRNDTRNNKPSRSGRNVRKSETVGSKTSRRTFPQHTAREREQMQTGLRILARIIARVHLRRQASRTALEPPPDKEPGN